MQRPRNGHVPCGHVHVTAEESIFFALTPCLLSALTATVTRPLHGCYMAVAWPLQGRCTATTWPVTRPLHGRDVEHLDRDQVARPSAGGEPDGAVAARSEGRRAVGEQLEVRGGAFVALPLQPVRSLS